MVRPWSASTTLPKTTLTSVSVCSVPVESMKVEEMQTGNGSASLGSTTGSRSPAWRLRCRDDRSPGPCSNSGSTSGWPWRSASPPPSAGPRSDAAYRRRRIAGLRAYHLLEDQHVAGLQVGKAAEQRCFGGALRQAAIGVAPGVELNLVVLGIELASCIGSKTSTPAIERAFFVARADRQGRRHAGRKV